MITLLDVLSAYLECRKRKRSTLNAINFELNALDNCVELWLDIINRRYQIGKSITFVVTKPKPREIFAASFRDRVVHHLLMARLNPLFEELFIDTTCNCRKGKGVFYGVKTLYNAVKECSLDYTVNCYIARFDLKGFFMSINKDILWRKVESFIKEKYLEDDQDTILYLADMIIHHCPEKNCHRKTPKRMWKLIPPEKSLFCVGDKYGLPIGNLTSLIFANFYLDNFDHLMLDKFRHYGRYVDDFYVVTRDKKSLLEFIPFIKEYLETTVEVTIHPNKTYILDYGKGCDFIGSTVKGKLIYTGTRTVRNCYDTIKLFNLDKDISQLFHFVCSLNSLFGFMRNERASYNLRLHISLLINPIWYEYMEYTSKGIFKEKTNYRTQIKSILKW